jgi:hypothetical protein
MRELREYERVQLESGVKKMFEVKIEGLDGFQKQLRIP